MACEKEAAVLAAAVLELQTDIDARDLLITALSDGLTQMTADLAALDILDKTDIPAKQDVVTLATAELAVCNAENP